MWKFICYVFIPIALGAINSRQVQVFATIELFGGIAKLCLVAGIVLLLICINLGAHGQKPIHSHNLNYGLQFNKNVADGYWAAVCNAIPPAIFAYLGIELVTMTAFEATLPAANSLRWPARNIAWIFTSIYLVTTCVFVLNVGWKDRRLPQFYNQGFGGLVGGATTKCIVEHNTTIAEDKPKFSAAVIAVNDAGVSGGVLVACFIYSTLSAANTGLFTASRAVYGLARDIRIEASSPWWLRMFAAPASVEPRTQSTAGHLDFCAVIVLAAFHSSR
jgi:amino acid transporter